MVSKFRWQTNIIHIFIGIFFILILISIGFAQMAASGDLEFTHGRWKSVSIDKNGKEEYGYEYYVSVWKKHSDGSWKFVLDGGNESPPDKSITTDGRLRIEELFIHGFYLRSACQVLHQSRATHFLNPIPIHRESKSTD